MHVAKDGTNGVCRGFRLDLGPFPSLSSYDIDPMEHNRTSGSQSLVALVTGGSAGLGFLIAQTLLRQGYRVVITGRNEERLSEAVAKLDLVAKGFVVSQKADVTAPSDVELLFNQVLTNQGGLDVLVNCVGQSDRGLIESLTADRLKQLFDQNVISTLLCCQASIPMLEKSSGVIINIGSLSAKVSPRYLGGYSISKHALAALSGQLRLELKPRGIHVGQINPGPIRRDDAGQRYADRVDKNLPDQANQPGGGARISGLDQQKVADEVARMIRKRIPDVIFPRHLRMLIAIGHALPRLGDWLLLKFTSQKS